MGALTKLLDITRFCLTSTRTNVWWWDIGVRSCHSNNDYKTGYDCKLREVIFMWKYVILPHIMTVEGSYFPFLWQLRPLNTLSYLCLFICLSVLCTAKILDILSIFSVLKSKVVMKYLTLRQNDIHWEMWFIFVSFISRPRSSNIPVQNCSCLHSLIGLSIADEDYWLNTLKTLLSDRKGTGRKYLLFIWQHLPIPARPWYLFMIDR